MRLIRPAVVFTVTLWLAPLAVEAQRPPEVRRVGYLQGGIPQPPMKTCATVFATSATWRAEISSSSIALEKVRIAS